MVLSKGFIPVIADSRNRWQYSPFNLRFDAKWTHQPGAVVHMDERDTITVKVLDRQNAINGMRFATGPDWIAAASGKTLRVSFTTKADSKPCAYRTAYFPQDMEHSGFYVSHANLKTSTFSFEFELAKGSEARTHLVIFEPQVDNSPITILDALLEVL